MLSTKIWSAIIRHLAYCWPVATSKCFKVAKIDKIHIIVFD